ncbi:hypothetical protein ElyMa_000169300 [Elysia marginata]|uniref:Uncharacterized protein n=1 Tax=Elysia marginata TaxID=1093978 RepID=A0AAV4ESJ0_9GAST|nr:hypothetical protein ElyMa_000169300 [Elysia marginata]
MQKLKGNYSQAQQCHKKAAGKTEVTIMANERSCRELAVRDDTCRLMGNTYMAALRTLMHLICCWSCAGPK